MADRPILFSKERRWSSAASRIGVSVDIYVDALNRGEKICGGCKRSLARTGENFGKGRNRCRWCIQIVKKDHYARTRDQQRERQIRYQRENREKLYAYNASWQRQRHQTLRCEAIAAYGGRCACCGESEPVFLDLDHINNDGAQHRREVGNTTLVMLSLHRQGWPTGRVQLLCCNCNQGKARNGGVCPHVG